MEADEIGEIRYNSFYPGVVVDNKDPLFVGRVKVKVGVLGSEYTTEWAMPSGQFTGPGSGGFFPPPIDAGVTVAFLEGDPEVPIYFGGYWAAPGGTAETPKEFQRTDPTNRGFKTPGGHLIEYDDLAASQGIRHTSKGGFKVHIDDKNKKVFVTTPGGHKFEFDDPAKKLTLSVVGDEAHAVGKNLNETVGANWTINVSGNTKIQSGGQVEVVAGGNCKVTASKIILNGEGSGITTKNSHEGVIDLITGVPVMESPTVFSDV